MVAVLGSNGSGEAEEPCGSFVSFPPSRALGRARGWAEHNLGIFPRARTLLASPWKVWLFLESWGAVLAKQAAFWGCGRAGAAVRHSHASAFPRCPKQGAQQGVPQLWGVCGALL